MAKVVIAFVLMVGLASEVRAQCQYDVIEVDSLLCSVGNPAWLRFTDINEQGRTAGVISCTLGPNFGTLWTGGTIQVLPTPSGFDSAAAVDLNESDVVVGIAYRESGSPSLVGVVWENGEFTLLPFPPEGKSSQAIAINDDGIIVGEWANRSVGPLGAAVWQNGVLIDNLHEKLGTQNSQAIDINNRGQIVGWRGRSQATSRVYLYDHGSIIDIGVVPNGVSGIPRGINEAGQVIGIGRRVVPGTNENEFLAFVWSNGQMIELDILPGESTANPVDINEVGQIVGTSGFNIPVLWQNGAIYKIADLLPPEYHHVGQIKAINNQGFITFGDASIIAFPIDSPPGDIDHNCKVDVEDLLLLLGQWGDTTSFADVDEDGDVDVLDLLEVLTHWSR